MRKSSFRVSGSLAGAAFAALLAPVAAFAQVYDGTSFVGLPVLSSDGVVMGEVVSEDPGADGAPSNIRVAVEQPLGLGEKTIELTREQYVGLQGAVTLDIAADEIKDLPASEE